MRHRKKRRQLNMNSAHRKSMFENMSVSLIKHKQIRTTLAKAKELRKVIEPWITRAKEDTVANRRLIFSKLRDKEAVGIMFSELGPHFSNRPGGYLRILKNGYRQGDSAPVAVVQLVGLEPGLDDEDE